MTTNTATTIIATDRPLEEARKASNRYTHECEDAGKVEYYFMCLSIIGCIERGQRFYFDKCTTAVESGSCKALAMRAEERAADKSIYWAPRVDPVMSERSNELLPRQNFRGSTERVDYESESYRRGRYGRDYGKQSAREAIAAKPKPKAEPKQEGPKDFSKAVAEFIEQETAKPAVITTVRETVNESVKPIERMPGESPLAFARRRKEQAA